METIIRRICTALACGIPRDDIHDAIVGEECSEELFFLCYVAATMIS